jgi:hypothetical protein
MTRPQQESSSRPGRCPSCNSRQKSMHPATQADGGEVLYLCPDSWHDGDPVTELARQQAAEGITGLHWDNLGHGGAA